MHLAASGTQRGCIDRRVTGEALSRIGLLHLPQIVAGPNSPTSPLPCPLAPLARNRIVTRKESDKALPETTRLLPELPEINAICYNEMSKFAKHQSLAKLTFTAILVLS